MNEFGTPAHRSTTSAYPFHHLTNDGLWEVTSDLGPGSPSSNKGQLRGSNACGRLDPAFASALLGDPMLLRTIVQALLVTEFPVSIHDDILSAAGLEDVDLLGFEPESSEPRRSRDPGFRPMVLLAYERRCAMCGFDGRFSDLAIGLEAAHVRWHAFDGPDELENGICLCILHHKLFDIGALGITDERTVAVSAHFTGVSTLASEYVLSLAGRELRAPIAGFSPLVDEHIDWHHTQVFRGPNRG